MEIDRYAIRSLMAVAVIQMALAIAGFISRDFAVLFGGMTLSAVSLAVHVLVHQGACGPKTYPDQPQKLQQQDDDEEKLELQCVSCRSRGLTTVLTTPNSSSTADGDV